MKAMPLRAALGFVACCLFAIVPLSAAAAPGDLDPGFGTGGRSLALLEDDDGHAQATAIQTDGKIVTAGTCALDGISVFCLARLDGSGNLDPSFDGDGKVTTAISDGATAGAVAIQVDGKIVTAGTCTVAGLSGFCLTRHTSGGSLDSSFDGDGRVLTSMDPATYLGGIANAVAIQSDGKIVAAGGCQAWASGRGDFCLARYRSDGSLDPTFGGDGRVFTATFSGAFTRAIVVQADGKLVVAGGCGGGIQFCLVRYDNCFDTPSACVDANGVNIAGRLDGSFGGSGLVTTNLGGNPTDYLGVAVGVQADGKLVGAVGCVDASSSQQRFCLARYASDGSLDPGFGNDGIVAEPIGGLNDHVTALAVQGDGTIVAAGGCGDPDGLTSCLARFTSDGDFDSSFGGDGKVLGDPTVDGPVVALAVQDDGKLVTAGGRPPLFTSFLLARYGGAATAGNQAPTGISLSPSSAAENMPAGTTVGNFSTSDPDAGDSHSYSLVAGAGDTDNAAFTTSVGSLKTAVSFNFEAKSSYTIRVRSSDGGGLSFAKQLTIGVTNANEAPVGANDSYSTSQGVALTVPVATGVLANDTDPDAGTSLTAVLVSGPANGTLALAGNGSFVYTPAAGFSGGDSFSYRASDGSLNSNVVTVTISVNVVGVAQQIARLRSQLAALGPLRLFDLLLTPDVWLRAAQIAVANNQPRLADRYLAAFIANVQGLVRLRVITPADGAALIASANNIRAQLR
jgi:uncharacterized delta-60 repeat protein